MVKPVFIFSGYDVAEELDSKYIVMSMNQNGKTVNYEFVENIVFDTSEDAISYYSDLEKDFPSEEPVTFCLLKVYADTIITMNNGKVTANGL